jgi:hypothetical protein
MFPLVKVSKIHSRLFGHSSALILPHLFTLPPITATREARALSIRENKLPFPNRFAMTLRNQALRSSLTLATIVIASVVYLALKKSRKLSPNQSFSERVKQKEDTFHAAW